MKQTMPALICIFIFLANAHHAFAQTEITVIPVWKTGETHTVKIKNTTTAEREGATNIYVTTWDASYKAISSTDTGYTMEWIYTKCVATPSDPSPENQILAKLLNIKLLILLDETGKFKGLQNIDEVRASADKIIDSIITSHSSNNPTASQMKGIKQIIATKQGLEIVLLKQIKFHQFSFGYKYKLNFAQTNNLKFPNPLGGEKVDAIEHVELTKLDTVTHVCTIETNKTVDSKQVTAMVIDYVKKVSTMDVKTIETEISKQHIELTESSMQQINYASAVVLKSFFKRTMDFGFQNMVTLLEIETVN